jgi:hypothetical protein
MENGYFSGCLARRDFCFPSPHLRMGSGPSVWTWEKKSIDWTVPYVTVREDAGTEKVRVA